MAVSMAQRTPCVHARCAPARRAARAAARFSVAPMRRGAIIARAGEVTAVNDTNFEEIVLQSKVPVLVDFWAPWCGPCRMILPIIEELSMDYKDKLTCVKVNTDESPATAGKYGIRSIPTVMIFKNGQKQDTVIGAVPKATLQQTIEKYT